MNWIIPIIVMLLSLIFLEFVAFFIIIRFQDIPTYMWVAAGIAVVYFGGLSIKCYIDEEQD